MAKLPLNNRSMARPWKYHGDFHAAAGAAFDPTFAADFFHALAHVVQTIRSGRIRRLPQSTAIIFDFNAQHFIGGRQPQPDFIGVGMFDNIVEGFFDDQKQIVPHVGRDLRAVLPSVRRGGPHLARHFPAIAVLLG